MMTPNHASLFQPRLVREFLPSTPTADEDAARKVIDGYLIPVSAGWNRGS